MIERIPDDFINGGDAVTGSSALTTTGAVPFVASPGVLTEDGSNLLFDDTNNRFQVGTIDPVWVGYESWLKLTSMHASTEYAAGYEDHYNTYIQTKHDNTGLGTNAIDLYGMNARARLSGNGTYTYGAAGGTGYADSSGSVTVGTLKGLNGNAAAGGSSIVASVYGGFYDAKGVQTATVTNLYGIRVQALRQGTSTITNSYGAWIRATSGASNNWNLYSEAGTGTQARNYLGGPTGIGPGNSTPSDTLNVKDATATTGATSVVVDIGAAQTSTSTVLTLNGVLKYAGENTTGAKSAALGANCPATTETAPYTWLRMVSSDGSTVYVPAWK